MIWIMSANKKVYDHVGSFKKNGFIDWEQNVKYEVGDIVFIYFTKPLKQVMYKCEVEKHSMLFSQCIDDKEFWKDINKYNRGKDGYFVRLRLIEEVDNDKLKLEHLMKHGLNAAPQWRPSKVNNTLYDYINKQFKNLNKHSNEKNTIKEIGEVKELDIDIVLKQFEDEELKDANQRFTEAEKLRKKFVHDYPIEYIKQMKIDEYLGTSKDSINNNSFCRRIRYELEGLAHMGNVYPDFSGVYYKNGDIKVLSRSLEKEFGDNVDAAFDRIKNQIVDLLEAAMESDYEAISKCKLHSSFKNKLLLVYYPDKFFPVCTKNTLDKYCSVAGISFQKNKDMIYKNIALIKWKEKTYPFCEWSNLLVMKFCDWICRKNIKVSNISKYSIEEAKKIDDELVSLELKGQDREAVVKVRVNQGIFRKRLLDKYSKCCLCNVHKKELLLASHIKPWSKCKSNQKLDVNNGLLLCPNHDRLFDEGWISFDEIGKIIISKEIDDNDKKYMNVNESISIELTDEMQKYMNYHRKNIFEKKKL